MKKLFVAMLFFTSAVAMAQDSLKISSGKKQKAHVDYFLDLGGVDGESSDSLPPPPGHLMISVGGTLSQTANSNLVERYSLRSKPGYQFSLGYSFEFRKSRLQINATYHKGGVQVAAGDINGDGRDDFSDADLDYLSIPIQYQFYLGRKKRLFIGAGGYAAFLVSPVKKATKLYDELNRTDAGVTGTAGVWLGSRIMLQGGYNFGLVDIDLSKTNKARNGMAFLVLSYSFTSKIKYGPIIKIKPKGG